MTKIIKPIKIGIDLQALLNKPLLQTHNNLLKHNSSRGALGTVTVLDQVFDLYLLNKYSSINSDEIVRWLTAAQIETCFRKIVDVDEALRDFYLQNSINVTIASDKELVETLKDVSNTYWILDVHTNDIQDQIQKVISWNKLLREITKYASVSNYELKQN